MTRAEFERRWDATPGLKNAELINGVVYVPTTISISHAVPHFELITWLGMYRMRTPFTEGADNVSIRLNDDNMPQPDALLRLHQSHGGRSRITHDDYLEGGPELIGEVADTTVCEDLGAKRDLYRRFGVQEYIVWRVADRVIDWFVLRNAYYDTLAPGPDGIIRSEVFPGLWLDPAALIAGDAARVLAVAQRGHGSPEHTAFLQELAARTGARPGSG
ncbi:Uma2 family endonuclease [Frigoriglobus tundricola]|uniref:Uma2 family endonuclease n=1 Tax=Frigoriglobus tundricola TaxID=2774151 RepID=UPI001D0991E3|nr:Uma2 family endonuclease [Frigoriglobus tundricola]